MLNWLYFIFLGTIGWGISLYLIKILLISLTPVEIVLYRMIIGAVFLLLLIKYLRISLGNLRQALQDGVMLGVFNVAIPFYLTTFAEKEVSSALAAVINGLTPLLTFVLAVIFFKSYRSINIIQVFSILIGLAGILIVNADFSFNQGNMLYLFALILSALSYGVAANYMKNFSHKTHPLLSSVIAACVTIFIMLCYKCSSHEVSIWHLPSDYSQLFALLWLGVIGSGLCLYLYCIIIQRLGAVIASMTTYLMTITGVLSGVLLLDENFSFMTSLGCVGIVISLLLMNHSHSVKVMLNKIGSAA